MSTSRSPKDSECTVDLGAQYITVTPEYRQKHSRWVGNIFVLVTFLVQLV